MSEMVERVAKAICWKNGMNPDLTLGGDGVNFLWHEYEGQARAAIEAMREPTSWMLNEAVEIGLEQKGNVAGFEYWQRMIDAALEGNKHG